MTTSVVVMIIIGLIVCISSFFVSEKLIHNEENLHMDFMTVDDDYEFSERELRIIKRKIEDVIANQAKDILYETNDSLSSMANEKTMALGDYAVTVCEEIEKNHKEVMFLYSMLDDKQKEIMKTVDKVNELNQEIKEVYEKISLLEGKPVISEVPQMQSSSDQLTSPSNSKKEPDMNVVKPNQENLVNVFAEIEQTKIEQTEIDFNEVLEDEFQENENSYDIILEMHRNGNSLIDIAKELGLGVGEVKLVIDLYRGE